VYSLIPDSDERDVQLAVDAATKAFPLWSVMPVAERADILLNISRLIDKNLDRLALAESIDQGKPVWLAKRVDIPRARDNFHFYATGAIHLSTEAHATENSAINYTLRQPIGIAGCISPWNLRCIYLHGKLLPHWLPVAA
jgi:aminomuconate-semialdehyde/2-hydroxymuconate-6-semialdehyde dehydrogenase